MDISNAVMVKGVVGIFAMSFMGLAAWAFLNKDKEYGAEEEVSSTETFTGSEGVSAVSSHMNRKKKRDNDIDDDYDDIIMPATAAAVIESDDFEGLDTTSTSDKPIVDKVGTPFLDSDSSKGSSSDSSTGGTDSNSTTTHSSSSSYSSGGSSSSSSSSYGSDSGSSGGDSGGGCGGGGCGGGGCGA